MQSHSCLVKCVMHSDVAPHLPSSAKHNKLVALFFARTIEGLADRAIVCTTADEDLCGRDMLLVLLFQSHGHRHELQGFR